MNRPIKFRAWEQKHQFMVWNPTILLTDDRRDDPVWKAGLRYGTLMQFTGLCDSEGKEIWENDIVHNPNYPSMHGQVKWDSKGANFYVSWKDGGNSLMFECRIILVIGNVFENPELLEVKYEA